VKGAHAGLTESTLTGSLALYAIVCPVSQSAVYVSVSLAVAAALLLRVSVPQGFVFPEKFGLLMGIFSLFVAWQCLSLVVNGASSFIPPLLRAWNFVPLFVLARFPLAQERKKTAAKISLFALFLSTSLVILVALFQDITGLELPFKHQLFSAGVIVGFFSHHLPAGGFFSTLAVLSVSLFLFWETSSWVKTALALITLILLLGTLLTLSRTYFVSLAVTLPLILLRKKFWTAMGGIAAISLLVLLAAVSLPDVKNRTLSILDLKKNPSNVERLYLWRVAGDMIRDHPVAGVGFKQWGERVSEYTGRYSPEWEFSEASFHHAHDVYLTVAAETGLVGLFFFLAFWLYLLFLTVRNASVFRSDDFVRALNMGASYVLINLLIGGVFEENFGTLPIMHLVVFVLTLSFFVTAKAPGAGDD
jgi:putative inorganic carbon (HCO3(-)) transporter